ncbi:hypothetical protein BJV77DRAFT_243589 [Russula vinacea]|nr:hypothetical protein BJV77DRAFT_243589 [Russula vinacea]
MSLHSLVHSLPFLSHCAHTVLPRRSIKSLDRPIIPLCLGHSVITEQFTSSGSVNPTDSILMASISQRLLQTATPEREVFAGAGAGISLVLEERVRGPSLAGRQAVKGVSSSCGLRPFTALRSFRALHPSISNLNATSATTTTTLAEWGTTLSGAAGLVQLGMRRCS